MECIENGTGSNAQAVRYRYSDRSVCFVIPLRLGWHLVCSMGPSLGSEPNKTINAKLAKSI